MQPDYSDGLIQWEDCLGIPLIPYTVTLPDGKIVTINVKNPGKHESWEPIQSQGAYHYNLGTILLSPDEIRVDTSQNPRAVAHRTEGEVLTYAKKGYISSLDMPSSWQYPVDTTVVTVKFTDHGNYTLTSQIFRSL